MKNVFIIVTSLNIGGAEMQSIWLANKYSEKGYKVTFIVLKYSTTLATYLNENIDIVQYKMYGPNKNKKLVSFRKVYNFISGIYLLRRRVNKGESYVFSFLFHSNIFGFLSTVFTNSKHIICIRSNKFSSKNKITNLKFRHFLIYISTFFSYKTVFNSYNAKKNIGSKLPRKQKQLVIFNSVLNFEQEINSNLYEKIKLHNVNSKKTFVSIGRLEPVKNYKNILIAFNTLKQEGFDFKYTIFGKGFQDKELINFVKTNNLENEILFVGGVKGAIKYLHLFDYFVLASIYEGFPNSLIEAMSEGLIPVSTDAGDSFDIISENRGFKIKGYSPVEIENSLKNIFNKEDIDKENIIIKSNISKFVKEKLNEESIFSSWQELIN